MTTFQAARPPQADAPHTPAAHLPTTAILMACWIARDPVQESLNLIPALLPLAGRTMIERVIDTLVESGSTRIDVVVRDHADAIEALLGDGTRWGCSLRYHFLPPTTTTLPTLIRLTPDLDAHYRIACADTVVPPSLTPAGEWAAYTGADWLGWACLSGRSFAQLTPTLLERGTFADALRELAQVQTVATTPTSDTRSATASLATVRQLLADAAAGSRLPGHQRSAGIWIGQGSQVHPDARLIAPVWIGRHTLVRAGTTLGPDCMLSDACVVDRGAEIGHSLIMPGTYVGQGLDVQEALVAGQQLGRADLQTALSIGDRNLLDRLAPTARRPQPGLAERAVAAVLWLVTLPLAGLWRAQPVRPVELAHLDPLDGSPQPFTVTIARTAPHLAGTGAGGWRQHFSQAVHPGLPEVVRGRLQLVGPCPRSAEELAKLPDYWRQLYRTGRAGLFNEALLMEQETSGGALAFAADALACEMRPFTRTLHLLGQYGLRVLKDRPRRQANSVLSQ